MLQWVTGELKEMPSSGRVGAGLAVEEGGMWWSGGTRMGSLNPFPPRHPSPLSPPALTPGVPDEEEMARFKHWASRLGSVISDVPLPHMPPGSQLVSLKEAMQTMQVRRREDAQWPCVCVSRVRYTTEAKIYLDLWVLALESRGHK